MLKKKIALFMTVAMTAALFAGCSAGNSDKGDIKIGAIMSLTGTAATYGQSGKNGIELLEKEVNSKGGINGRKVKFMFEDDEGKSANAITVGEKLIDQEKAVGIIGPLLTSCCLSFGPIAQKDQVPMITGTGTAVKVTQAGNYIFRACFIDPFQGKAIAKFSSENLKAKKAAVLYDNNIDYSKGLAEAFTTNFEKSGGKVVSSKTYNTGDKDFSAQLTEIKAQDPDVLYLPDYYSVVAVIAKQARAMGIKAAFLGGDGWDSSDLSKIGGDSVEGAYYSNHYSPDDTSAEVQKFTEDYKSQYGSVPDTMAALNYDAAKLMVDAIKRAGKTDGDSIRKALTSTNLQVVSGRIKFDSDRNAVKPAVIVQVKNGSPKFVTKVNP